MIINIYIYIYNAMNKTYYFEKQRVIYIYIYIYKYICTYVIVCIDTSIVACFYFIILLYLRLQYAYFFHASEMYLHNWYLTQWCPGAKCCIFVLHVYINYLIQFEVIFS